SEVRILPGAPLKTHKGQRVSTRWPFCFAPRFGGRRWRHGIKAGVLSPSLAHYWKIALAKDFFSLHFGAAARRPQFLASWSPQVCEVRRSGKGLVFSKPKRVYVHTKAKNPK